MSNNIQWHFAETGGGEQTGLNDPVISNFLGDVSVKLVREALQNSIDARIADPVIVDFNIIESKTSAIPGVNQLRQIFSLCIDHWKEKNKDVVKIFDRLIGYIQKDIGVSILKISDYNTKGLTPDDYHFLFEVIGGNTKGEGQGGSFGLGKGAYFGASQYRTVFVSSMYDKDKYYFAGKTRLVSFNMEGRIMQGSGTFGYPEQKPVTDIKDIPEFFQRKEKGTDFYIYGYQGSDWKKEIINSVLHNFWYAILNNILVVKVGDVTIDQEGLVGTITEYHKNLKTKSERNNSPFYFFYACAMGEVSSSKDTFFVEGDLPTLGLVKFFLYKNESCPNKVAYIRNTGMTIQTKNLNAPYPYAGVFVCENTQGNEILRKMENPEHNKWDSNIGIVSGKLDKKIANNANKELRDFVLNVLKSFQETEEGEELKIKELDKYLWLPMDEDEPLLTGAASDGTERQSENESAVEITKIDQNKIEVISKKEKLTVNKSPVKGKRGGDDEIITNGKGKKKKKKLNGEEDEEGDAKVIPVIDFKYRSFAELSDTGEFVHTLILKAPKNNTLAKVVIRVGTDSYFDTVDIWSAYKKNNNHKYSVEGNVIKDVVLDKNGEEKLLIKFVDGNKYSLNVLAYGYK